MFAEGRNNWGKLDSRTRRSWFRARPGTRLLFGHCVPLAWFTFYPPSQFNGSLLIKLSYLRHSPGCPFVCSSKSGRARVKLYTIKLFKLRSPFGSSRAHFSLRPAAAPTSCPIIIGIFPAEPSHAINSAATSTTPLSVRAQGGPDVRSVREKIRWKCRIMFLHLGSLVLQNEREKFMEPAQLASSYSMWKKHGVEHLVSEGI